MPRLRAGTPIATYRLQLSGSFDLDEARRVLPYLAALGVTHPYLAPIFRALPGSTHGYDVCQHTELNPELGGMEAYDRFVTDAAGLGMGIVLDFVPNHMSNDAATNEWWRDVLENGPSSPYARYFDIDWDPLKPELKDRLLLPILGEAYGEALERGALALHFVDGQLRLDYCGAHHIPVNPRRAPLVYEHDLGQLQNALGESSDALREFLSILTALKNLPAYTERDPQRIDERQREKSVARDRLVRLTADSAMVRDHIERAVAAFNGTPGDPASFDRLHELLQLQAYRLASWRTAADEINYRRFFDVNALAALRVEDPEVFDTIHRLLLALIRGGKATGVRLDHIDGLKDPLAYLTRLDRAARIGEAGVPTDAPPPYVVVEKILSTGESLRTEWPTAGTTGYTFLNEVNGVFVDGRAANRLRQVYARVVGETRAFEDVAYESKRLIVATALSSEFQVLAQAVNRLSEHDRRFRDFTFQSIRRALREVVACFPAYRTYVSSVGTAESDVTALDLALDEARRRNPAMESSVFDFLRYVLSPKVNESGDPPDALTDARLAIAMRFQQYTAPVQAKGVEDTAFYRYHALISLNEVGGDPTRVGHAVADLHRFNGRRLRQHPDEMLATSTHDTKRGEDSRARINVISEVPGDWRAAVSEWRRCNAPHRTVVDGHPAPDGNDEYLFYQALLGTWPVEHLANQPGEPALDHLAERMVEFMTKAIREAKLHTSWITPHVDYEAAVAHFTRRVLSLEHGARFLETFRTFASAISRAGVTNSLAQLILKCASPGVPDVYQGAELWDFSLVDPDNRRPVDWTRRQEAMRELEPLLERVMAPECPETAAGEVARLLDMWTDGRIKLFLTALALRWRSRHPLVFSRGEYIPVRARGLRRNHLVAFARRHGANVIMVVVPRLTMTLAAGRAWPVGDACWTQTTLLLPKQLAVGEFCNLTTGERVTPRDESGRRVLRMEQVLTVCPVALLWAGPVRP